MTVGFKTGKIEVVELTSGGAFKCRCACGQLFMVRKGLANRLAQGKITSCGCDKIRKAYRFRIYPDREQQAALAIQFGHARFVYNHFLTVKKDAFFQHGLNLSKSDLIKMLPALKESPETEWLKQADSQVLQMAVGQLDDAYQRFFKLKKEGKLPPGNGRPRKDGMPKGFPTYHKKYDEQSITYPQRFELDGSRIVLPKVGRVRAVFHRPLEGELKKCTVTKTKSGKYFISIQVELERPKLEPLKGVVGIDLGLKSFAVLSRPIVWAGQWTRTIPHPQFLRQSERKLKALQRKYSRTQKGSAGREQARLRLARQHEHIANQRANFLHQLSHALTTQYGYLKIEDLNVAGMVKNHSLAKSISDSGWAEFGRQLAYKAEWQGGFTERIDRWFPSSKTCSGCQSLNQTLQLQHRFWVCAVCGMAHDRDETAANNIETYDAGWSSRRNAGGACVIPLPESVQVGSRAMKPEAQAFRLG